jgi:hypothetical protein
MESLAYRSGMKKVIAAYGMDILQKRVNVWK